jgi:hypothetical protein
VNWINSSEIFGQARHFLTWQRLLRDLFLICQRFVLHRLLYGILINPRLFMMFTGTTNCNPNHQHQTVTQVWVQVLGLAQEYLKPKVIFAIASSLGTSICLDIIIRNLIFM